MDESPKTNNPIPPLAIFGIVLYLFCYVSVMIWGYYLVNGIAMTISFLIVYYYLDLILEKITFLKNANYRQQIYFLFFFSLILRFGWLVQDQIITKDIEFYVERSQALVDGQKPYIERADINKPPLFALYIWIIGFSTDVVNGILSTDITYYTSFRVISSIGDSLVVLGIFWIAYEHYSKEHAQYAAMTYAIFPIAIETSGLSGHYDPFVILCTLVPLKLLWPEEKSQRLDSIYLLSGFFIGLGIALKFYQVVMIPFFLFIIYSWRGRLLFSAGLPIASLLSYGILEMRYPGALKVYREYQGGTWMDAWMKSFARAFQEFTGSTEFLGLTFNDIFISLFGIMGFVMVAGWIFARHLTGVEVSRYDTESNAFTDLLMWFVNKWDKFVSSSDLKTESGWTIFSIKVIGFSFIAYYGTQIAAGFYMYESGLGLDPPWLYALEFFAFYAVIVFFLYKSCSTYFDNIELSSAESFVLMLGLGIMVLMFGSPDYPTWYICWYAPFVMIAPTYQTRMALMLLLVWNFPGESIALLPDYVVEAD